MRIFTSTKILHFFLIVCVKVVHFLFALTIRLHEISFNKTTSFHVIIKSYNCSPVACTHCSDLEQVICLVDVSMFSHLLRLEISVIMR